MTYGREKMEKGVSELVKMDVSAVLRQGVYLLSRAGNVVYVGQSKCPLARIAAHRSLARRRVPSWLPIRGVIFETVEVIPCHPDRIDALERGLIEFYRPVHNKIHNPEPPKLNPPSIPHYTRRYEPQPHI